MSLNYKEYEDFLSDDSFLNWHFRSKDADIEYWEKWITENSAQKYLVDGAVKFLNDIRISEKNIPRQQLQEAEQRLFNKIKELESPLPAKVYHMTRRWWLAAASVAVIAISLFLWRGIQMNHSSLETQYGEIKQQQLPDGSEVVLNANSNIRYSKNWIKGESREVWVKGEAFFKVQKTVEKSKFIVHTDRFDIVVTGTQFNVVNKQGKTNVLLKEGSLTILTKDGREINMKAGDYYEYVQEDVIKKEVKPESILAWKDNKIDFDNATLNDAVKVIKEHYGITIKLEDESLGSKPLNGIMANNNLDILLKAIEEALEVQVIRNGNEVIIKP